MPTMAILGGSVIGSAAALLFARSGWRVTIVEQELDRMQFPTSPPTARPGAPHTVQAHGFVSRAHQELALRLPDVLASLYDAGAERAPVTTMAPPQLYDGGREDDDDLGSFRCRRITMDAVMSRCVATEPSVVRVHERATGIVLDGGSPPRATGWGLANGDVVPGDVLLDAGGRRSPVSRWLAAAGIVQPERRDPCGLAYYGRHYRIRGPRPPLNNGFADIHEFPTFVQLMFVGDNDRVQLALSPHGSDPMLKVLRHEGAYEAVLAANRSFDPWREVLEPETGVYCLGALGNRMRSLVADGRPLVLGLHQVGDSLAMTNPNRGRGISMGMAALGALHDRLPTDGRDPDAVALDYGRWQDDVLAVYYREAAATDARMGRRMRANRLGGAIPANAPAVELPRGHQVTSDQIGRAAQRDPDLFRIFLRALLMLDDERRIASPEVATRVRALPGGATPPDAAAQPSGVLHDRAELLRLLAPWN